MAQGIAFIGENGTRKQAFAVLQEFYARKAAEGP